MWILLALFGCEDQPVDPWDVSLSLSNTSSPGDLKTHDGGSHDIALAPGLVIVHAKTFTLFTDGDAASPGLEALAEDGDPATLLDALSNQEGIIEIFNVKTVISEGGTYADAPIHPGESATIEFTAQEGTFITLAQMFGQSNDVFVGTSAPIPLYDQDYTTGELNDRLSLFDAGTEQNEEPGVGPNQAPRQAAPGDGHDENGTIQAFSGDDPAGFPYPAVDSFLSFTLTQKDASGS